MSTSRPLLVVGLQKSGTTLLGRLLEQLEMVAKPFRGEGDAFWGNEPPFAPKGVPVGVVYQQSAGAEGHVMRAEHATEAVRAEMHRRLEALDVDAPLILNKNPYNTVRLPWLRAVFPDCFIAAMVRRPLANVFSLIKKYVPHEGRGLAPQDGWWGVKPPGWRDIVNVDKLVQCAEQWRAINRILQDDLADADVVLSYHELCADPAACLERILRGALGEPVEIDQPIPEIRCFDSEFATGSGLRSKNRLYRTSHSLETSDLDEEVEIEPLTTGQIEVIRSICGPLADRMEALA